ncbi:MAG: hypothetical protein ACSW8F_06935, partial [bacterium]
QRHHYYDKKFVDGRERGWHAEMMYYLVAGACSLLSIYKIYMNSDYNAWTRWTLIIIVLIGTLSADIIMWMNTVNYVDTRENMIKKWEQIKQAEEAEQKKSQKKKS